MARTSDKNYKSCRKYLVTGGAGFIGSNFIKYMLKNHSNVFIINFDKLTYAGNLESLRDIENHERYTFIQGDICDKSAVESVYKCHDVNCVVNFAAESHVDRSISDPDIFAKTNILGTLNLLNVSMAHWADCKDGVKFLQVSTDEVYGSLELGADRLFTETTPLNPRSPYAASKTSADLFVKAYADTYKLPVNITRCSNNYGPYQFPEKLIPLMLNNALQHKELPVYGDGLQVRDWLYVDDHCKAIDMVIQGGKSGEIYNVGGQNERANIDIVKMIVSYIRQNTDGSVGEHLIRHVADRKGHDRRYGIDAAKIREDLGWTPETPFETGIIKTIGWYLTNKDWLSSVTSRAYKD